MEPCMARGCLAQAREKSLHSLFQSKTNWFKDEEYIREKKYLWVSVKKWWGMFCCWCLCPWYSKSIKPHFHTSMSLSPLTTSRCKPGGGFPALQNKERRNIVSKQLINILLVLELLELQTKPTQMWAEVFWGKYENPVIFFSSLQIPSDNT